MSRNEITMRLLSAEARVPLHHMRTGQLTDDDWTRLARRMGEVSDAPLFIDDSPNMSMMEIRAKCRRLKQRHDLKLVDHRLPAADVVSGKRVESRQQEVSEFSRALKLLAKELEVPGHRDLASSTVAPSSAPTRSRSCPTCASRAA